MEDLLTTIKNALLPWHQTERLRHPWAGWLRVGIGVIFPFIIWSHDLLLIVLLVIAMGAHPYWFPAYVEAGEDQPLMTRLVDKWAAWMEETDRLNKALVMYSGFILTAPLLWALWTHNLFWSIYFYAAIAAYKTIFCRKLLQDEVADDS